MSLTITPLSNELLFGQRVVLEKVEVKHANFLKACYSNDKFMNCYRLAQDRDCSLDQIKDRLRLEESASPQKIKRIEWVIRKLDHNRPSTIIGIAALADYQFTHKRAEFLIGIPSENNRLTGLGLEASLLVLEFAFLRAKLHKLTSFVYSFNTIAQKNTLHLGFHQEGVLKQHYYNHWDEKFIDLYQNALLQSDFFCSKYLQCLSKRILNRDITQEKLKIQQMNTEQLDKGLGLLIKQSIIQDK